MKKQFLSVVVLFIVSTLVLSACNLPNRQIAATKTPLLSGAAAPQNTSTPPPLCVNPYFPNRVGVRWEYSGTNSLVGDYTRTDVISSSADVTFTQETTIDNVTYSVPYDCSTTGIMSINPVQQYAGALLNSPNTPVNVKLTSNTGTSLPSSINPGNTWQQTVGFEATSQQLNVNGRFVFDYAAVGFEDVTVKAGAYNALRVNATIRIEVTGLHILAGTYTTIMWLVPGLAWSKVTAQATLPASIFPIICS